MVQQRLKIGDNAPEITVLNTEGQEIQFNNKFWEESPVLLCFLRHFGWPFCRERLVQLEKSFPTFKDMNVRVITIGIGQPKHANRYCSKLAPNLICLSTSNSEDYYTYGLHPIGLSQIVSSNVFSSIAGNVLKGNLGGIPSGDIRLPPGTFIVDSEGKVQYTFYGKDIAEHPAISELLEQANQLVS